MAPRQNIPIREILYQLSPYQQDILSQAFHNAPKTFLRFWSEVRGTVPGSVLPWVAGRQATWERR